MVHKKKTKIIKKLYLYYIEIDLRIGNILNYSDNAYTNLPIFFEYLVKMIHGRDVINKSNDLMAINDHGLSSSMSPIICVSNYA